MVSRPPSPAIAAVAAPHGEGFHVPRVFGQTGGGSGRTVCREDGSVNAQVLSWGRGFR
jgi:hypothetical protein